MRSELSIARDSAAVRALVMVTTASETSFLAGSVFERIAPLEGRWLRDFGSSNCGKDMIASVTRILQVATLSCF